MAHTEDIPNVCEVNLPNSFSNVTKKTITSIGQIYLTIRCSREFGIAC